MSLLMNPLDILLHSTWPVLRVLGEDSTGCTITAKICLALGAANICLLGGFSEDKTQRNAGIVPYVQN